MFWKYLVNSLTRTNRFERRTRWLIETSNRVGSLERRIARCPQSLTQSHRSRSLAVFVAARLRLLFAGIFVVVGHDDIFGCSYLLRGCALRKLRHKWDRINIFLNQKLIFIPLWKQLRIIAISMEQSNNNIQLNNQSFSHTHKL